MESPVQKISLVPAPDRRQSETALAIARGTARLLHALGFACISELPLPSGRRADLVALNERGEIWIVEIKSSVEDLPPITNGKTIAPIATGCSSRSRRICRARFSRNKPA